MVFLEPLLLCGLGAVSIPILLHLISRHRIREMDWAAMSLLKQAAVTRTRRIRLEDLLLLLLRIAALALLALALARPVLTWKQDGAAAAGHGAQGTLLALDASYSMGFHLGVSGRFERGVQAARDILKNVSPGTHLTVLLLGRHARLVYKSLNCNPQEAAALLDKLKPTPETLSLDATLETMLAALREMDTPVRECYLITDVQRTDWGRAPRPAFERFGALGALARVFIVPVGDEGRENLAVINLRPLSGHMVKGEMLRLSADIWNPGATTQEDVKVQLVVENTVVDEKSVSAGPGQTVPVFLYTRLKTSGSVPVSARLGEDGLLLDNTRYAVLTVRESLKVLCVDGTFDSASGGGDSRFLAAALAPGRGRSGGAISVERVSRAQVANLRLFDYQLVALVNVADLPAAVTGALVDYVRWGGGMLIFAGDQLNAKIANASLGAAGLLPGELSDAVGDAIRQDRAATLVLPDTNGALARNLAALPKELLAEPLFYRRMPLKLLPDASVMVRLDDNSPLVVERPLGHGRILFFNCTADDRWTNLPRTILFPVLVHQAVTELTREETARTFTVGEEIVCALPPEMTADEVTLTGPTGETTTLKTYIAEGRRTVSYPRTDLPGIYTFQAGRPGPTAKDEKGRPPSLPPQAPLKIAINVDTKESDVECLPTPVLEKALAGLPLTVVSGSLANLSQTIQQARTGWPLWRPLLLAALLVFLVEFTLAYRYSLAKLDQIRRETGIRRPV